MNTQYPYIYNIPKFGHIIKTLWYLHCLATYQRIFFKILILTYQVYHKTVPQYLCDLIILNVHILRFDNMLLIDQCHPMAKLISYEGRSFQYG